MAILSQIPGLSVTNVAVSLAGIYILVSLSIAVYNVYFHPLARFPGPTLRCAFHFPHYWNVYNGDLHLVSKALHEKYGEVVRLRPNVLSFANAAAWKDIYGSRPGKGQIPKDPEFYTLGGKKNSPDIIFSNDTDHSRIRKLVSHAFSDSALRDQEPILNPYFELLVSQLRKEAEAGRTLDLTQWYNYLTFDIVADLCFGESFHALENGEHHSWVAGIFKGLKIGRLLSIASFYPPGLALISLLFKLVPKAADAFKAHENFARSKTAARLDMKTDRKDFMNYILKYNDERGMTRDEIMATSGLFLIAGSETTATLLSGLTYHLLMNPDVLRKAQKEVRDAFAAADDMTLASTSRLPYLQALLEEGLRIYPPVPLGMPRRTAADGAWVLNHYVPPDLIVPQWTCDYSPENWTEPEVFAPERWLENPPAKYKNDNRAIRQPFSVGPRNCVGKNLAYNEMRSVMARMLWHFDIELCPESKDWPEQNVYFLWEKHSLQVRLSISKNAEAAG